MNIFAIQQTARLCSRVPQSFPNFPFNVTSISRMVTNSSTSRKHANQAKWKNNASSSGKVVASLRSNRLATSHQRNKKSPSSSGSGSSAFSRPPLVDYSTPPPIIPSPPAPPRRGLRGWLLPVLPMIITVVTAGYIYINNKNDNYEFWDAMQSGKDLPLGVFTDDDDDDNDDDDDDEDDEEET